MRTVLRIWVCVGLAGLLSSCGPKPNTSADTSKTPSAKNASTALVHSQGQAVLHLTMPPDTRQFEEGGKSTFVKPKGSFRFTFYLWPVSGASTLDQAAGRVGEVIKSEFLDFKLTGTKELTVAGKPAKQLIGTGKEADDHDPGNAEVVLFEVGGRIFAACVHGEDNAPDLHRPFMMETIRTAQAP